MAPHPTITGWKMVAAPVLTPLFACHVSPMRWEGQAVGAENMGINVEVENQALVDWGAGRF